MILPETRLGSGAQGSYWTTYLFDPDGIASLTLNLNKLDLKIEAPVFQTGREAVRLVGVPVEEWAYDPDPLHWGPTSMRWW